MRYELLPFDPIPARHEIVSKILREVSAKETLFSDFGAPCAEACVVSKDVAEMCDTCRMRMTTVAAALSAPNTRAYEVWDETPEVVGVIYFSDILPGIDAKGHYVFFDGGLSSKTEVIEEAIQDVAAEMALERITIEIPAPFVVLARHASRKLGFGGPFKAALGRKSIRVEGVKTGAVRWRGVLVDLLILGRSLNDASTPASPTQSPEQVEAPMASAPAT